MHAAEKQCRPPSPPLLESVFESCLCLGFYVCGFGIWVSQLFVCLFIRQTRDSASAGAGAERGNRRRGDGGSNGERHAVRASPGPADILFNPCLELDECSY